MKSEKTLSEGMLVPCLMTGSDEWSTAEVIKIRGSLDPPSDTPADSNDGTSSKKLYYVHYVDTNKRLDCWVTEDRLDVSKARLKGQESVEKEKKEEAATSARSLSPTPTVKEAPNLGTAAAGMLVLKAGYE